METLNFVGSVEMGSGCRWPLREANYIPRVRSEGLDLGGIRSERDQGTKREQGVY